MYHYMKCCVYETLIKSGVFRSATRLDDYEGNVCGGDDHQNEKYVFFPILPGSGASIDATLAFRLCVSDCKKTMASTQV